MDWAQWITAVSTALIALVFLVLAVLALRAVHLLRTLAQRTAAVTTGVEQKVEQLQESGAVKTVSNILQSALLAMTLWKTLKRRRVS